MAERVHGAVGEQAAGQVHVHADQRDDGHDDADERDVDPHIAVDHVVGELARLAVHDVLGLRVDAHGQGRGGVGQQVDPQQLRGEQRQGHTGGLGLGDAQHAGQHDAAEHGEHLTDVGAQQVAQELADVVEDAAAFAHGGHDGGEVVVRQDHLGGFLCDLSAGDAHGHADVGGLDGRGVVDAVAGHGGDVALTLQRGHNLELVLRGHTGVDGDLGGGLVELLVGGQRVQLVAGQRLAVLGDNAEVGGDAGGGQRVVAGDHDGADAGAAGLGHGVAHLGARRVDDADHAGPDQVVLDDVALFGDVGDLTGGVGADARHGGQRRGLKRAVGLAEGTVGLAGQALDVGQDVLAVAVGERADLVADRDARAEAQQHVRGALGEHGQVAALGVVLGDDRHALALGGERHLRHAGEALGGLVGLGLTGRDDQRHLGRIADDLPLAVVLAQVAVVRQRAGDKRRQHLGAHGLADIGTVHADHLADRRVAGAGDRDLAGRGDDAFDGHLVTGQRTGLVGADHGGGAQRLHGAELLDDGVVLGHALHAEREHDGHDGGQALGHGGHGQRDGQQQRVDDVLDAGEAFGDEQGHDHQRGDDAHGDTEDLRDVRELLLQRGGLILGLGEHVGDLADLRVHAGAGHDGAAGALGHGRAVEHHVGAVAEGLGAFQRLRLLADRHGFAGQARLCDAQRGGGQQSAVGGDGVALAEHDDIAGDDLGGVHAHDLAVTQHRGLRGSHLGERGHGLFGAGLLNIAEHGVDDQDQHDHDRIERQRFAAFGSGGRVHALDEPRDRGDHGGGQQQVDQRVLELGQELLPLRHRRRAGQLVRAELLKTALGFVGAQAGGRVDVQRLGYIIGIGQRRVNVMQQGLLRLRRLRHIGLIIAINHGCCSPQ